MTPDAKPELTVIALTYNRCQETLQTLEILSRASLSGSAVLAVDYALVPDDDGPPDPDAAPRVLERFRQDPKLGVLLETRKYLPPAVWPRLMGRVSLRIPAVA